MNQVIVDESLSIKVTIFVGEKFVEKCYQSERYKIVSYKIISYKIVSYKIVSYKIVSVDLFWSCSNVLQKWISLLSSSFFHWFIPFQHLLQLLVIGLYHWHRQQQRHPHQHCHHFITTKNRTILGHRQQVQQQSWQVRNRWRFHRLMMHLQIRKVNRHRMLMEVNPRDHFQNLMIGISTNPLQSTMSFMIPMMMTMTLIGHWMNILTTISMT